MKILHCLLMFVMVAMASVFADEDQAVECKHPCFRQAYQPVCAYAFNKAGTFYNQCEADCDSAKVLHEGECEYSDMLHNKPSY